MNKEKLIEKMRDAFKEKYNLIDFKTQNIDLDGILECFAEAALKELERTLDEFITTQEEKRRYWLSVNKEDDTCREFTYYDAKINILKEFKLHILPSPPKDK